MKKSIKTYLKAYNFFLAIGWSILLCYWLLYGRPLDKIAITLFNICQIAAILEIIHAVFNWTKTPVVTSILQISSRIFVLLLINILPESAQIGWFGIDGITLILIAWSITEIIRYSYYFTNLIRRPQFWLENLRYSLFLGLYPIGVTGEILIIVSAILFISQSSTLLVIGGGVVLISYVVFFPKMYNHMLQQRAKKLTRTATESI